VPPPNLIEFGNGYAVAGACPDAAHGWGRRRNDMPRGRLCNRRRNRSGANGGGESRCSPAKAGARSGDSYG